LILYFIRHFLKLALGIHYVRMPVHQYIDTILPFKYCHISLEQYSSSRFQSWHRVLSSCKEIVVAFLKKEHCKHLLHNLFSKKSSICDEYVSKYSSLQFCDCSLIFINYEILSLREINKAHFVLIRLGFHHLIWEIICNMRSKIMSKQVECTLGISTTVEFHDRKITTQ
jgi:hypothetical protein